MAGNSNNTRICTILANTLQLANVYTGAMVGSHGNVIIADAYFRGVPISNVSLGKMCFAISTQFALNYF